MEEEIRDCLWMRVQWGEGDYGWIPSDTHMWVKTKTKRRKGATCNCGSLRSPRRRKGVTVLWFLTADFYEEGRIRVIGEGGEGKNEN